MDENKIIRVGHIFRTSDYAQFKRLDGNRAIQAQRVKKIVTSIQENGYILNPIVVNERMEVIDGQGRLEALRLLGLPVDYVIATGTGLEECVALNAYTTSWALSDYIESYCEIGNDNYLRLRDLLKSFNSLRCQVVLLIASGYTNVPTKAIKRGAFKLPPDVFADAAQSLEVASRFKPLIDRVKGTTIYYYYAVVFAVRMGASESRLFDAMSKADLKPAPNIRTAMDHVSDIYNLRLKDPNRRIYLTQLYENTMTNKYGWYYNRFGEGSVEAQDAEADV